MVTHSSTLTYTITVSNSGPDQAIMIKTSDAIPSGTTFNSVSVPAGVTCTHPAPGSGGTVACTIGSLNSGANIVESLVVNVTASPGTTIIDKVTLNWGGSDPDKANNSATAKTLVN